MGFEADPYIICGRQEGGDRNWDPRGVLSHTVDLTHRNLCSVPFESSDQKSFLTTSAAHSLLLGDAFRIRKALVCKLVELYILRQESF